MKESLQNERAPAKKAPWVNGEPQTTSLLNFRIDWMKRNVTGHGKCTPSVLILGIPKLTPNSIDFSLKGGFASHFVILELD